MADGLKPELTDAFERALRGPLIRPGDANYDLARRVWNGNVDRRPALIARCMGVADVRSAVNFARDHDLVLSVRGGGHSAPGYGANDGGLALDMSLMKGIRIDPATRTARAEGGVLWRDLDHETQAFGLATTGGTVSNTGIAGLTLGGGNFGAVTSFEYQLHPVDFVLGGMVLYPLDQARDVLRFYREFCPTLPDAGEANCGLLAAPDGTPVIALLLGYNGPIAEGEQLFAPARAFGRPIADTVAPMSYGARQVLLDEPNAVHGLHRYWRSTFADRISDDLIDLLVEGAAQFSSPLNALLLFYMHGACTRVASDATAFAARRAQWDFDAIGCWTDGASLARHIAWVRELSAKLEPHMSPSTYVNHISDDDKPELVRASFGENFARLRRLKGIYDPENLFRVNANIAPG